MPARHMLNALSLTAAILAFMPLHAHRVGRREEPTKADIYVSTQGNDSWSGRLLEPSGRPAATARWPRSPRPNDGSGIEAG